MNWKIFFGLLFVLIMTSTVVYGAYNYYANIESTGNVKAINIEVYWDSGKIDRVDSIDWGVISPTETKNVTIYIYNSGNSPVYLSLNSEDWYPEQVESVMVLNWDYNDNAISPSQGIFINLSLTMTQPLEDTTISNFSYTIIISAYN